MTKPTQSVAVLALFLLLAGCVGGGIGGGLGSGGGDDSDEFAARTDTYDNCGGGGAGLLIGGGLSGGGAVRLGMSECELVNAIGTADEVLPQFAVEGERRVILSYAHPQGGTTAYLFVNNALKEINRVP